MTAAAAITGLGTQKKRVLVVDDSLIMRNLVKEIVESDPDLEVVDTAENGRIALQKVRELKPDAVLLDIQMPEMSGLETLRRLGLRSRCKVVVLSSLVGDSDSAERIEALRLGAAATIGKPSGGVSLDLKQKRASEVVGVLRRVLGLPEVVDAVAARPPAAPDLAAGALGDLVLEGLETAVLMFDHQGVLARANRAAQRVLPGGDLAPGRTTIASLCGNDNDPLAQEIWDVIAGAAAPAPADTDFADPQGNWIPLRRAIHPLAIAGRPRGALLLVDDISEKRQMQALLDKSMSSDVARSLIAAPGAAAGGEMHDATILFADIRDFTPLAESLGARGVVDLLNQYFSYMADVIGASGGIIDKYIGDAIMALFGLPASQGGDADRAVAAARNMQRALVLLNDRLGDVALRIGVGIGSGPVIAGQIGSADRMNYTVIGDPVNLAARIESVTKNYGCAILVCEDTVRRLTRPVPLRKVDVVTVRGRSAPTTIYEVFVEPPGPDATLWLEEFHAGLEAYLAGEFSSAQRHLTRAQAANRADAMPGVLAHRCRRLSLLRPEEWTGAWPLTEK
jgi:class 3 adenylate cyclase/DNA-binding NarL/FixJ family response regulator